MAIADKREIGELRVALGERAEDLVTFVLGAARNNKLSTRRTAIWGSKGSFKLEISGRKQGLWYDHEAGEGGDLLGLIQKRLTGGKFAEAVVRARQWLGWPTEGLGPDETANDMARKRRAVRATESETKRAESEAAEARERARKARSAARMWAKALPIERGGVADRYLRETRCIVSSRPWPDSLRYLPGADPGLLAAVTKADGGIAGVHLIRLTEAGLKRKGGRLEIVKQTFGSFAGSAVRLLGAEDGPLLIAEGVETALSAWSATGIETWAALGGIANVAKLELPNLRKIVICVDDDARFSTAEQAGRKAIRKLKAAGYDVVVASPWEFSRHDKSDLNDVLKACGPDAVRARIDRVAWPKTIGLPDLTIEAGRALLDRHVGEFFSFVEPGQSHETPPVHALGVDLGVGKTSAAIRHAATNLQRLREAGDMRVIVYAVPEHRLSAEVAERFRGLPEATGLTIATWRGREAGLPGGVNDARMCGNLDEVREALEVQADVENEVCKSCSLRDGCPYLKQRDQRADLWIVSHQLIFRKPPAAVTKTGVAAIIVDESPTKAGLIGAEGPPIQIALDALDPDAMPTNNERLRSVRQLLKGAMRRLPDGPVPASALKAVGFDAGTGIVGYGGEWARKITTGPFKDRVANKTITTMSLIWRAVEALLTPGAPERSGWISVGRDAKIGNRVLIVSGRRNVQETWHVPTLLIDATMDVRLLKPYWPTLELKAQVAVLAPHQRIHQVAQRSFAKSMLAPPPEGAAATEHRKRAKARHKIGTFVATVTRYVGGKALFIGNKATVEAMSLPPGVATAHFNAVAGRDEWRDVRTVFVVGRTQPPPAAVERMAAALTGNPVDPSGEWYLTSDVNRLKAAPGGAILVPDEADRHPDPIAEAFRARIAEGEVLQAVGRGRGVNRTAGNPLDVFVLSNAVLPVPIDDFLPDEIVMHPSIAEQQLAIAGVAFESPAHARRAYPELWRSAVAARKAMQRERDEIGASSVTSHYRNYLIGKSHSATLVRVAFQLRACGMHRSSALVDATAVVDPAGAIEALLGPLASFEVVSDTPWAKPPPKPRRVVDLPDEEREEVQRALAIFAEFGHLQSDAAAAAANGDLQQVKADSADFMKSWTTEAVIFGWSPEDLFAPEGAKAGTGLACWLGGEKVRAFGPEHAITYSGRVFDRIAA